MKCNKLFGDSPCITLYVVCCVYLPSLLLSLLLFSRFFYSFYSQNFTLAAAAVEREFLLEAVVSSIMGSLFLTLDVLD